MVYPWAGIGSMLFEQEEQPIEGTDTGWNLSPSYAVSRPLGSATDSIVTTAIGSARRSFQLRLSPDRFADVQQLVNVPASLVDWERPLPTERYGMLLRITEQSRFNVLCGDGVSRRYIVAQLEFVSQIIGQ